MAEAITNRTKDTIPAKQIMIRYHESLNDFDFNPSATDGQITEFERIEGLKLPTCYRDFLKLGNGGEGAVGEYGYARLWKIEEISELNRAYKINEFLPGYLIIGSDGGGEAFAIKLVTGMAQYVQVPFAGLSERDCEFMGNTFRQLLAKLSQKP